MSTVSFRKIDIDALDPENQISEADLMPPQRYVSAEEIGQRAQEVKQALSKGDYVGSLAIALDDPPYGADETSKSMHLKTIIDILATIRASDISSIVQQLNQNQQDVLIKYLYKGMGSPLGQSHGNGAILLSWFEKAVDITGQGPIIRYMSDRRKV